MEFTVDASGLSLPATLDEPARAARGGVVVLHAAEAGERSFFLYQHLSEALTSIGVAVLRYDRRTSSNGTVHVGHQAADAVAAIRLLRDQAGDVPMGLWGLGTGALAAAAAAIAYPAEVDFVIAVSVPGGGFRLSIPVLEFQGKTLLSASQPDSESVELPGCTYWPANGETVSEVYTSAMTAWLARLLG
ncbi:alpha/beta fold hydrolase [Catelliglobosispora koreensis]|uniref:hypothetical protein n=1 Tax=Catelliglobosispora koreensis TaxID=129052 RepID=UPI000369DA03|nr:hypothetical protein [Catelliglobosispora koreensis]